MEIGLYIFPLWGAFHQGLRQWQSNQQRQDFNKENSRADFPLPYRKKTYQTQMHSFVLQIPQIFCICLSNILSTTCEIPFFSKYAIKI